MMIVRSHGDPVSKDMRDRLTARNFDPAEGALDDLAYLVERLDAHAKHQQRDRREEYDAVARRVREAIDFIHIEIRRDDELNSVARPPAQSPKPF
jgi:hypothetical protein